MTRTLLDVPLRGQEKSLWCWAAVASALSAIVPGATPMAQCTIAKKRFGQACCDAPDPCNQPSELEDLESIVAIRFTSAGRLLYSELVTQVEHHGMPVPARLVDENGDGHFVIIVGCDTGARSVIAADPNSPADFPATCYEMDYETFRDNYGGWAQCREMFTIG